MSNNKWTPEIVEFLKENVNNKSNQELADLINNEFGTHFTKIAINSYKTQHGIKDNDPYKRMSKVWTPKVIEFISQNYEGKDNIELAELINKEFNMNINSKTLCMFKNNYKRRHGISFQTGINRGIIQKGNIPKNKGVKGWQKSLPKETQEKIKIGWFKKGNISANAVEIGTESVKYKKENDYLYVKITNGKGKDNWKPKHHIIWEEHYGEIPKNHYVIFADGNRRNFDIDNLILVSKAEELDLNFLHLRFNDKELTKTGLNIVKLHKKTLEKERNMR